MVYIKLTLIVGKKLYRLYCHNCALVDLTSLQGFFDRPDVMIYRVEPADEFDLDDDLEVIMVDESGIYFW